MSEKLSNHYLCFISSSELILLLNWGRSFCRSSLTFSLSATCAGLPDWFLKRKVLASPLCITSCSCTFSLASGDIFWTEIQPIYDKQTHILHEQVLPHLYTPNSMCHKVITQDETKKRSFHLRLLACIR